VSVKLRINNQIRAQELRVIDAEDGNLGVMSFVDALARAKEKGLDLIEISPDIVPPVAKIMDYGKFQYEQSKKNKKIKAHAHVTETKTVQVKIGTSEHDLGIKAKKVSEWLKDGHRVRADLYLAGRAKYMDEKFLKSRLERILVLISENYKVADPFKKAQKGYSIVLEREGKNAGATEKLENDKNK
jgi:translation initiation factor IF-3